MVATVAARAGEEEQRWEEKVGVAGKVVAVAREARVSGSAKKVGATMDHSC